MALSGTFSPRGTGAQSGATSLAPSAANSRRASYARARSHLSTANSVSEDRDDSPDSAEARTATKSGSQDSAPSLIDDTDSPELSAISRSITAAESRNELSLERTVTARPSKVPTFENHFTAEELEQAMAQASLRPRRGTVLGPIVVRSDGSIAA
ncbi:uncharacterized protein AB675_11672 [Cyphellophora attinorum]|uniref:Uncharacterized protein n=1 Tax=Cyphellophora attinorum TaxID=1664694 RepID=A0A0N1GY06_9EURO|nr:uncharacterized protein AB675_11672 [Phialophora attinorum]KPI35435.1 hypothetical protein AB675_11672 [Phialophora attinorum]